MYLHENQIKELISAEMFAVKELIQANLEVDSKLACKMLGCQRVWLVKNRRLFDARVINRRGDRRFSTVKILQFKKDGAKSLILKTRTKKN
jgi:hypothetical protein